MENLKYQESVSSNNIIKRGVISHREYYRNRRASLRQ
jgi:hypothetical protein